LTLQSTGRSRLALQIKTEVLVVKVELLYFDGCPHWRTAGERLVSLQSELGFELNRVLVSTPEEAIRLGFTGSPTIRVDGVDPFAMRDAQVGFACRMYETPAGPAGSPTVDQLRTVVSR
jgi:hypothetical protein